MKQFLFLVMATTACGLGSLVSPFWAVLLYYGLATLRPQNLWDWALPMDVRWSLIAAGLLFLSALFHGSSLINGGRINKICGLMMAYGVLVMMSVLSALNPSLAEMWAVEYGKILVVAIVASLIVEHFWQIRLLALMAFAAIAFLAYEINYGYLVLGRLTVFHTGYGGYDNNGVGLLLAMGVPLAFAFATMTYDRWALALRGLSAVAGLLMLHAVMMTYSRGAMVAATAGLIWQFAHHRPRWQAGIGGVLVIAAVLALAGPQIREEYLSTRNYQDDASAQARFKSWGAAWQIAWDFPLFGAGVRNSNLLTYGYGADIDGRTVHNQYLQVAADSGIPAGACYIAMVLGSMWFTRRARLDALEVLETGDLGPAETREVDHMAKVCLAIQSSLVVFGINGLFLSLEVFELPWMLMVLAGVAPAAVANRLARLTEPDAAPPEAPEASPAKPARERVPPRSALGVTA